MAKRYYNYRSTSSGARQDPPDAGGGAPAWVPANAVIHVDFLGGTPQGRAWVAGTGEVAVDTLVGADANANGYYGSTGYNSANLTANGYASGTPLALLAAARTLVLDDATFVLRLKQVGASPLVNVPTFSLLAADGADALSFTMKDAPNVALAVSEQGGLNLQVPDCVNVGDGASNGLAGTITMTRADIACSGSAAATGTLGEWDRPPSNPYVAVAIVTGASLKTALQSITLYDPLPDTTGLSELSEV